MAEEEWKKIIKGDVEGGKFVNIHFYVYQKENPKELLLGKTSMKAFMAKLADLPNGEHIIKKDNIQSFGKKGYRLIISNNKNNFEIRYFED